jgi:DNA-binding LytR/AlgR family response regulator
MRGEILRLSAADHVVRVVTDKGVTDLRMRFGDAVNEMAGVEGCFTHRSQWVAVAAIAEARREAGRWVIVLCNGDEVPVSRKNQPALNEAGLLKA